MGNTIGNAPLGENTSLTGTEKVPLSGSKYTLLNTIRSWLKTYFDGLYVASGGNVLSALFDITAANGVMQDTALSITLPQAGIYKITGNVRGELAGNAGVTAWWLACELYNVSDGAVVANSERLIVLTSQTGVLFHITCSIDKIVTVSASKQINLYVSRNGGGIPTWTTSAIDSNSDGRTELMYELIG